MTNLNRKELIEALNVLWKLSADIQLNVCTTAYSETIVPQIGELRTCDALDAAAKLIHSVLDGIVIEGEADTHLIMIVKEEPTPERQVKMRKNSIYGQMIAGDHDV